MDEIEVSKILDSIATDFDYSKGVNGEMIRYTINIFKKYFIDGSILELGPADGLSTSEYFTEDRKITLVEGSQIFCEKLMNKFDLQVHNSTFESFNTNEKYSNIIASHILEHVEDPIYIMTKYINFLKPGGRFLISVPNANSFHRVLGVKMNKISHIKQLTESDIRIGHKRVFTRDELLDLIVTVNKNLETDGYRIVAENGFFLKIFSNSQLEQIMNISDLHYLMELGEAYAGNSAELYMILEKI